MLRFDPYGGLTMCLLCIYSDSPCPQAVKLQGNLNLMDLLDDTKAVESAMALAMTAAGHENYDTADASHAPVSPVA